MKNIIKKIEFAWVCTNQGFLFKDKNAKPHMKYIIKKIEFAWVCKQCYDEGLEYDYPFHKDIECCGLCKGICLKSEKHFISNEHHEKYIKYPLLETCDSCGACFEIRWHCSKGVEFFDDDEKNT